MSVIQDKINAIVPDVNFVEAQYPTFTIPQDKMRQVARMLHDDPALSFDYLVSLTGVDEGEEKGLGVVYHLTSSVHNHWVVLKTFTTDRENPLLYSVSDIWATADLNEREVFDFFGVRFIGHNHMSRLYLRQDFKGYPLRKDFDPTQNPLTLKSEDGCDETLAIVQDEKTGAVTEEKRTIFSPDEYVVNVGPQHPATHGVLHFRVSLDGEIINKIDVNCGYIHRGIEKLAESKTYPQQLSFTDRLDYLSAHMNRHALCNCIEKALGIEVSDRVKYIRTIMDELQRINSHLLFYATFCMDFGALTTFFYGFRDREKILDIFEGTTGGRLIQNYNTIGGVQADLAPDFVQKVKEFIKYLPTVLPEYHKVFTGNVIAHERMVGIGVLSKEDAISYGVAGPSGRASGWACDVRKTDPYAAYDKVDFKEIVRTDGDVYGRYIARMDEIVESLHIIEQLIDNIPEGDIQVKTKPVIKLPEGEYFSHVEGARGDFGVYIESRGDKYPYRLKYRSSGLTQISVVDKVTRGHKIADLIAIGASLDYVVPDIDR
ncbi:MAG: NADH-quinone oxidoreductase subunit C [Flavobacteriales bacterium]|nr:NADH-quinone oxidoreductase subunit C [Flavobacteriales bacterium]